MATASTSARKNGSGAAATSDDVEAQIARIREDIAELTKVVGAFGSAKANQYTGRAEKVRDDLAETSQQAIESVREEVASLENDVRDYIREKPLQTVGIAAGVGFLLAFLSKH
ncbi:DUF883 family protein [Mariluticola halotolerans]|uniref:DUF883 family protein n=1 Tax=Mariluticola halotolerans TaxID=2909283 RepID=UPI0026E352A7|nr:DUF883 domain-containing protein [Mariluticola halotolerans]UJQ95113.1 DUF883 domain-containing protein [Mariluticola halotolerans]